MKKIFSLLVLLFLVSPIFAVADDNVITNIITKESFKTRTELKAYIDEKSSEYNQNAEEMIIKSMDEVKLIINDSVSKILLKAMLGIFSIIIFSGSTWYFIRLKLDNRKSKIIDLKLKKYEAMNNAITEQKPVKTSLKPIKKADIPKPR